MRWTFADPANPGETAYRQRTLAAIDRWWRSFQAKASDIAALFHRRAEWDLPRWMDDTLGAVHPRIMWEYGPGVRQRGHRLLQHLAHLRQRDQFLRRPGRLLLRRHIPSHS